ncbi:Peptidase C1 domain containing protein [Asbolus verrucosus]|uniref:Peptidase C1 domain containing protein n=1 Tax=Asbolus verrucosus TaxID=1661398 RepID=A0A482VXW4_ASBVE|nr:Peptidase C1 domain containing protein [Asbolus verrucosus]
MTLGHKCKQFVKKNKYMEIFNWIGGLLAISVIALASARDDYPDLRGPYCQNRGCCPNREDECSVPIIDFWSHCKGILPPPTPEPILGCTFEGIVYPIKKIIKRNCNVCKCELIGGKPDMMCEQHQCIIEPLITDSINNNYGYGWSASNYSEFWGRKLDEGIKLRLGTLQPHRSVINMNPVRRIYDPHTFSTEFDSEMKWPGWISQIHDQGWCGSSWAISTAAVASDRFAILSKGREKVTLSAQHLLSCDIRGQQSCNGGYLDRAWSYIRKFGLVDENCFPYTASNEKCRIPRRGNLIEAKCTLPQFVDRKSKYKVAPAYRIGNETDIMYELLNSGPVQATMKVYHDFFTYKSGIYRHTNLSANDRTGYHSVRIVGWGEDYTPSGIKKYWKVANSWGPEWGENGYFRIARGTNECEIESFVLGTWPEIENKLLLNNAISIGPLRSTV